MAYPTRVRYGLRLLVRLALQEDACLSLTEVAQTENISVKYLEQIVNKLKPVGLLESMRGVRGGYCLARDPASVTLAYVFESLGGLTPPVPCLEDELVCGKGEDCTTRPFWESFDAHVRNFLENMTLADIAASVREKAAIR